MSPKLFFSLSNKDKIKLIKEFKKDSIIFVVFGIIWSILYIFLDLFTNQFLELVSNNILFLGIGLIIIIIIILYLFSKWVDKSSELLKIKLNNNFSTTENHKSIKIKNSSLLFDKNTNVLCNLKVELTDYSSIILENQECYTLYISKPKWLNIKLLDTENIIFINHAIKENFLVVKEFEGRVEELYFNLKFELTSKEFNNGKILIYFAYGNKNQKTMEKHDPSNMEKILKCKTTINCNE
ncbi:hypothetical protein [Methanobrevibacter sp. DSM 116169]|uniref:hypothetical protein n=1 Tax=Methanobrevibacter sp. DSM 116169 TaxID=3242727 RepID=UPI0038FCA5EE